MTTKKAKQYVAARLREARGDQSQDAFAAAVDITQCAVSRYEAGLSLPGLLALAKIRRVTGVDLNDLADGLVKGGK